MDQSGDTQDNVLVTLTGMNRQGQSVTMTTVTDMTGAYFFANVQPGTYMVTEGPPQTENNLVYDGTTSYAGQIDGAGAFDSPNGVTIADVTLGSGDVGTQFDFINNYSRLS